MTESSRQLEREILKWLTEHGYPLEMRIARSLARSKFGVTQSHYFRDHETDTAREIDVLGRLYGFREPADYNAIAELETFVAVECKSLSKPWIVFCETRTHTWRIQQASCSESAETLLRLARKEVERTELYSRARRSGHGIAQAFGGNSDLPYAAMLSALKAAEAHAIKGREREVDLARNDKTAHICESSATIPVVVTTSPLFECRLSKTGDPELSAVKHSSIAFRYPPSGGSRLRVGSTVHVVTEDGWADFEAAVVEFHKAAESKLNAMIPKRRDGG